MCVAHGAHPGDMWPGKEYPLGRSTVLLTIQKACCSEDILREFCRRVCRKCVLAFCVASTLPDPTVHPKVLLRMVWPWQSGCKGSKNPRDPFYKVLNALSAGWGCYSFLLLDPRSQVLGPQAHIGPGCEVF